MRRRWPLFALAAATAALSILAPGRAQPRPDVAALRERLEALVTEAGLGERVGIAVADAATGRVVFASHADVPLNPASNMKLVTAAALLEELGPEHRMQTGIYGAIQGDAVVGGLVLRGGGDPSLSLVELQSLANELVELGVRTVDEVVVDGSYFDAQVLPPAFEQRPAETAAFRAAVGAASVDENAYALRVLPGPAAGEPAVVRLAARTYFEVDNRITTSASGEPRIVAEQHATAEKLSLVLRGEMPLGVRSVTYRRRVEHPLLYAGHALVEGLRRAGIRAPARPRLGRVPETAVLLASRRSPPLGELVSSLGKESDNFYAETLLKVLGAERRRRPGRTADGVAVALGLLGRAGVPAGQVTMVNGSGLYQGNLVAASHLVRLLSHVYRSPAIRAEYLAQLAIGGVDGTLAGRLRDLPAPRIVRAKTGTLDDVVALSGYVLGPTPDRALAFSVLANGVTGHRPEARGLCDGVARALAEHLHPPR